MRFGVIGLGSMGKRRVRDLLALGHDVIGFDLRPERNELAMEKYNVSTVTSFDDLISKNPDALIISTPPDQHLFYYQRSFEVKIPFFSEANIFTPTPEWFAELEEKSQIKSYPSATWHFYPIFGLLKHELQNIGFDNMNSIHHHYADFLPRWHPWEHYSDFYAGKSRKTCAAREMVPFELDWLCWIFGPIKAVCAVRDRCNAWVTDIDDTYMILLEFESGLRGTLNIELHQISSFRIARIACKEIGFEINFESEKLNKFVISGNKYLQHSVELFNDSSFDFEKVYFDEIKAFADAVMGISVYPKTWKEDRHLSDVLFASELSWDNRAWIEVAKVSNLYDGQSWVKSI